MQSKFLFRSILSGFGFVVGLCATNHNLRAKTVPVWEKVEITLEADKTYANPYQDVEVWVDLTGPGFAKRCYGFWDGHSVFRVRVLATQPGQWKWKSGSNQKDNGLNDKSGSFTSIAWTSDEKKANPLRRGMIKPSANGHAFEYADGMPYFLLGDTWWAAPTFRFPWSTDGKERPIGPDAKFQDYVRHRKAQGYNCIAMLASLGNWANDGKPASLTMKDGTVLRSAWKHPGTKLAKDMHDEDGNRAFAFPGKVPGYENYFPDVEKINPKYFQNMDRKIDYLNKQGFVPFIEVARRDIGQAWKKFYPWPDSYVRYVQYIWSRYQANICLFSPIHFDSPGRTIPASNWNNAANAVIEKYGKPPFGTLCGTNSNPTSLINFGHTDKARWLGFHQLGNRRTHNNYSLLTDIYHTEPPVPAINGEPYYDGMDGADSGSKLAALYSRSGMYGSVLSGGFGGHIYGAGGWDGGLWGGNVSPDAKNHIWDAMHWPSASHMQHLDKFVLSEARKYQQLVPKQDLLTPNRSGSEKGYTGWAYCARTEDKELFLLYFEKDCPQPSLAGALPDKSYHAQWFNPRTGKWLRPTILRSNPNGKLSLPKFPENKSKTETDWALRLKIPLIYYSR
jgi:uncharacterized protein DUF4038/uncharacterized protein DUF5060/collagenase-like protein with putative collagen-binding domain